MLEMRLGNVILLGWPEFQTKKTPVDFSTGVLHIRCLAVTYFHMGKPHTIIGAEQFHFRVRDGIGWFPLAMAARQTCTVSRENPSHRIRESNLGAVLCRFRTSYTHPNCLGLYGQATRAISTG